MSERRALFERIASALERIAPPVPAPTDWNAHPAYVWSGDGVQPVSRLETTPLASLKGIDQQKTAVVANLSRLASGAAAHDMLLWGSRGMGKSALIRAGVQALEPGGAQHRTGGHADDARRCHQATSDRGGTR